MPGTVYTDGPEVLVDLRLSPDLRSPSRARRALDSFASRFDPDTRFKLTLLISELVTNSVKHAQLATEDQIGLRVTAEESRVRVEVLDPGQGLPAPERMSLGGGWQYQQAAPDPEWPGGWGLSIVESLADRWGVVHNDLTTVWFEVTV
jgi:anti-sigma regulatory factor (Ser/Thr protein kinase)